MMIWKPKSWDETLFLTQAYIEFWDFQLFSPSISAIFLFFKMQFSFVHIVLETTFSKYFCQLSFICYGGIIGIISLLVPYLR